MGGIGGQKSRTSRGNQIISIFFLSSADEAVLRLPRVSGQGCSCIGPKFSHNAIPTFFGILKLDLNSSMSWLTAGKLDATNATLTKPMNIN